MVLPEVDTLINLIYLMSYIILNNNLVSKLVDQGVSMCFISIQMFFLCRSKKFNQINCKCAGNKLLKREIYLENIIYIKYSSNR
jgi:hypothetical protein